MPEVQDITGQDPNAMDAQTYQQLLAKIQNQGVAGNKQQLQNLDQMRQTQRDVLAQPNQLDLSPLMALSDQMFGTKYAPGYKAPESPEARRGVVNKLQQQIVEATGKLTDDQTKLLKTQLETMLSKEDKDYKNDMLQTQRQIAQNEHVQGRNDKLAKQQNDNLITAQKVYDKAVEKPVEKINFLHTAKAELELALTNPQAHNQLPVELAKAAAGRISERELKAFEGGAKNIGAQLDRIAEEMKNGTMTQANHDFMLEVLEAQERSEKENIASLTKHHASTYAPLTGMKKEDLATQLSGGDFGPDIFKPAAKNVAGTNKQAPQYIVGQTYTAGDGKKYKYLGGPTTGEPTSWELSPSTATQSQPNPLGQ